MTEIEQLVDELRGYPVIITGSYTLKLLNFLPPERECKDIDLVFRTKEELDSFIRNSKGILLPITMEAYEDTCYQVLLEDFKSIKLDCFVNNAVETIILPMTNLSDRFKLITVQNPRQIIQQKIGVIFDRKMRGQNDDTYYKHLTDLSVIFKDAISINMPLGDTNV